MAKPTSQKLSIIPARTQDIATVAEKWAILDSHSAEPFGGLAETADERRLALIRTTINSDNAGIWIAQIESKPVGIIALHIYERPAVLLPCCGVIHGLWVAPEHRRKGIAQQLVAHTKQIARERNAHQLQVAWHPSHEDAAAFWLAQQSLPYETAALIKL